MPEEKTPNTTDITALDAIHLAALDGTDAMPAELGTGFSIVTTEHGGMQLAFHWTDTSEGGSVRRTTLVQGGMLSFFDSLGDALQKGVEAARKREVVLYRGELSKEKDGSP